MAYEIKYRSDNEMKDSGIEWLGKIPKEWEVTRIKDTASNRYKSFVDGDWIESNFITEDGIRLIQTGNIGVGNYREQGYRYISDRTFKTLNCTEVFESDILICRLAEPVGRACLAPKMDVRMITSVDVCILKPNISAFNKYLVYTLSNQQYLDHANMIARGGTRQRISRTQLGDIRIPIGPLIDQQKIANFLDIKIAEFDSIISKKELLIEKLEEAKKSLISEVVTGKVKIVDGELVDRKPEEMKDSGVEWLGMIPKDWDVRRLGKCNIQFIDGDRGTNYPSKEDFYDEEYCLFLNTGNIKNNRLSLQNTMYITQKKDMEMGNGRIRIGDIVITTRGTVGSLLYFNDDLPHQAVRINSGMLIIRNSQNIISNSMLFDLLKSMYVVKQYKYLMSGSVLSQLPANVLKKVIIAIPSMNEQIRVSKYIKEKENKFNILINKTQQQIKKLKEAKQSLISEAVTGKIDLRDWEIIETGGR